MINIILNGAMGQMGRAIMRLSKAQSNLKIILGIDKQEGMVEGISIIDDINKCTIMPDLMIDFSRHDAASSAIDFCVKNKIALVMGTTGLSQQQTDQLKSSSTKIPIFYSSNMSKGVYVLHKLAKLAAACLQDEYDIEIVEAHHSKKLDAPSGTAKALFATLKSVKENATAVYNREGSLKPRDKNEIGLHSIRGGAIAGDHDIIFAGQSEQITLSHTAFSRDIFAQGALDAAIFLANKPCGFYCMDDLMEEKK